MSKFLIDEKMDIKISDFLSKNEIKSENENLADVFHELLFSTPSKEVSDEAKELLSLLRENKISLKEIFQHPWMKKYYKHFAI